MAIRKSTGSRRQAGVKEMGRRGQASLNCWSMRQQVWSASLGYKRLLSHKGWAESKGESSRLSGTEGIPEQLAQRL